MKQLDCVRPAGLVDPIGPDARLIIVEELNPPQPAAQSRAINVEF
jgi:hypothetical protein